MNLEFYILNCACLITAGVFVYKRSISRNVVTLFLKVVASMCFVIMGFAGAYTSGNFSRTGLILIGLIFGMLGDIFLDLKYVDAKNSVAYTAAGFASFIFGHVFYITFILDDYPLEDTGVIVSLIAGLLGTIFIYVSPRIMKMDYGNFRLLSAFYAGILIFVTVYAGFKAFLKPSAFTMMFFIGLVLFLISDLILSQIYFTEKGDTRLNSILNHSLYYAAQILIAASTYCYSQELILNG